MRAVPPDFQHYLKQTFKSKSLTRLQSSTYVIRIVAVKAHQTPLTPVGKTLREIMYFVQCFPDPFRISSLKSGNPGNH